MPHPIPDHAPVDALPNLGPQTRRWLAEVGIATVGDLRGVGAAEAFVRLRFVHGPLVTRNALHGLEAALRGMDWRHLSAADKADLERRTGLPFGRRPLAPAPSPTAPP